MLLFKRRDTEEYTDSLARYLPDGEVFSSKFKSESNLRALLRGMSSELFRANGFLREYNANIIPDETVKFIEEWESVVGIPDECFPGTGTNDERRRDILVKLASLGVQTVADFEGLADLFDIDVTVTPGEDSTVPSAVPKFTIVVTWFAVLPEQSSQVNIVSCLFGKLKPANVELIFVNLNQFAECGVTEMECGEVFAECNNSLF